MKTDDLINALAADGAAKTSTPGRVWSLGLAGGAIFSLVMLVLTLKIRSDIGAVAFDPRFLFKFVAAVSFAVPATWLAARLARPAVVAGRPALLAVAPVLLAVACGLDLWLTPEATWQAQAMGHYAPYGVTCVPLFALAPLGGILYALSRGAPTNQRVAGLFAGLAAGGVGAVVYALHCPDDSPLFLTIWYSLAVAFTGAIGAFLGPYVLKW